MHLQRALLGQIAVWDKEGEGAGSAAPASPPLGEAPPVPAPAAPAAAPPETPPAEPPATPPAPKPDWRDARIAELTAKLHAVKAAPAPPPPPRTPGETDAQFQARVNEAASVMAVEIAQQTAWNQACNAVAAAGNAAFKDFGDRLKAVQGVVNVADPQEFQQYNQVLETAIETGKGHQLIYALGADPGEFLRLMRLNPVKRALEIAGMASKLDADGAAAEPSGLPAPITPIGSRGTHYDGIAPDDAARGMKLPKNTWFAEREKQARERGIQ